MERLQKIISKAGAASRREAERLILAGRVTVNGLTVTELGTQADADRDVVAVDGVNIGAPKQKLYFLLNKPGKCISAVRDDRGRRTVVDLLPEVEEYIYPVGRLDYDTEGLLLLTNDGELMNGLLHPRYEIEKTYIARAQGMVTADDIRQLCKGVMLEDGMTAPARAKLLEVADNGAWSRVQLTIHEGRNRQVRRMLQAVGHRVQSLKRTAFAGLTLAGVPRGRYRSLTSGEVDRLKKIAGAAAEVPAGAEHKES